MTQIITPSELEHLTETELHSKFCDIQKELSRPLPVEQQTQKRITLENIHQAIKRRRMKGPKP